MIQRHQGAIPDIQSMVQHFMNSEQIPHRDYHRLCSMLLSDKTVNEADRSQLHSLLDAVQSGRLKVIH